MGGETMLVEKPGPVGIVGLGNLGAAMASALVSAGWSVTAVDKDPDRLRSIDTPDMQLAPGLEHLNRCRAVCIAVSNEDAVGKVLTGSHGLLDVLQAGTVVLVHSTVRPATVAGFATAAADKGVELLDAPVSGGADRARVGDLTLLLGGNPSLVGPLDGLLSTLASKILHVGSVGQASAMKLCWQVMIFSNLAGAIEAARLADAYEIPEETLMESASSTLGASWISDHWGFFDDLYVEYHRTGTAGEDRSWNKDVREALDMAKAAGIDLPVTGSVARMLDAALRQRALR